MSTATLAAYESQRAADARRAAESLPDETRRYCQQDAQQVIERAAARPVVIDITWSEHGHTQRSIRIELRRPGDFIKGDEPDLLPHEGIEGDLLRLDTFLAARLLTMRPALRPQYAVHYRAYLRWLRVQAGASPSDEDVDDAVERWLAAPAQVACGVLPW
jgi:hypothetical protein